VLREDQSGTYGVRVTTAADKVPKSSYALSIDFSCAPERTEDLVKRLFLEISRMRMDELSESYIRGVRERWCASSRPTRTRTAGPWPASPTRTRTVTTSGRPLAEPAVNRTLSAAMIQEAARTYLDTRNYVRVTLVPEKK